MSAQKRPRPWKWTTSVFARNLFNLCRMLHLYISTAVFSLLMFFAVTGITLNHPTWTGQGTDHEQQFSLLAPEKNNNEFFDPAPLLNLLESEFGLRGASEVNFDLEMGEVTVDFSIPAGYAFALWELDSGSVEVGYHRGTFLALMNDLHKGRHTGGVWSWLIDVVAVSVVLFSVTGIIILLQQAKRRIRGLYLVVAGTLTPIIIYLLWVPHISS